VDKLPRATQRVRRFDGELNMAMRALITGITGQDGSYLAELLLSKGYQVHGLIRRASTFNTSRIDHLYRDPHDNGARLFLHYGDLSDGAQLTNLLYSVRPEEIYHLGSQSHVRVSFDMAEYTGNITGLGTTRLLEALRSSGVKARFYQASSSEMFGNAPPPQNEMTSLEPRSPYAAAKVYAYWLSRNYREAYGLFISNGILFNHESPRRGETFVTRKITRAIAMILAHQQKHLFLGNMEAQRDWGYAPEYVTAMWTMLQQEVAGDYVIGTGQTHSVKDFVQAAFAYVGLDWHDYVRIDPRYMRPTEVNQLQADCSKAKRAFNWEARVSFQELVMVMVDADMASVGLKSIGQGKEALGKCGFQFVERALVNPTGGIEV
jgi:GDPmannose 4,6-dehydratase